MLWALLTGESLSDLLYTGSSWPGKGGGSWVTPMHASSPSLEVGTRLFPLSSVRQHVKGVLLSPDPMLKWTVLYPESWAPFTTEEKQSTKPGCSLELPSLSTGKSLKDARKDHRSAWIEEVTSRQMCFFFFFFFLFKFFPLSYSMVIRNIVIKQQV